MHIVGIPNLESKIAGDRGKRVWTLRIPDRRINTILVLLECAKRVQRTRRPQLDAIIPTASDEGVLRREIPVDGITLMRVLLEASKRIVRCLHIPEFDGSISRCRGEKVLMILRKGAVIKSILCVKDSVYCNRSGIDVQYILLTVADDAEVLGGRYSELLTLREFEWRELFISIHISIKILQMMIKKNERSRKYTSTAYPLNSVLKKAMIRMRW